MLIKVSLGEEEFRKLVEGKQVDVVCGGSEVAIVLQDIGWNLMHQLVAVGELERNLQQMRKGGGANG